MLRVRVRLLVCLHSTWNAPPRPTALLHGSALRSTSARISKSAQMSAVSVLGHAHVTSRRTLRKSRHFESDTAAIVRQLIATVLHALSTCSPAAAATAALYLRTQYILPGRVARGCLRARLDLSWLPASQHKSCSLLTPRVWLAPRNFVQVAYGWHVTRCLCDADSCKSCLSKRWRVCAGADGNPPVIHKLFTHCGHTRQPCAAKAQPAQTAP